MGLKVRLKSGKTWSRVKFRDGIGGAIVAARRRWRWVGWRHATEAGYSQAMVSLATNLKEIEVNTNYIIFSMKFLL